MPKITKNKVTTALSLDVKVWDKVLKKAVNGVNRSWVVNNALRIQFGMDKKKL